MCGRFVSASTPDDIARYFDADAPDAVLEPSYNVAPTDDVYGVRSDGSRRRVEAFHWGLVPSWAEGPKIGARMINARAEGLAARNAFKAAFQRRRCLVPADGFYEWRAVPGARRRQPVFIHRPDGAPLALAGLWELWRDRADDGEWLRSCTIVTTEANETLRPVHDRMPVLLGPADWDEWLDPGNADTAGLQRLLRPAPADAVTFHPVSTQVNDVRTNGPDLIARAAPPVPATLFD